jgi:hypothetical protein
MLRALAEITPPAVFVIFNVPPLSVGPTPTSSLPTDLVPAPALIAAELFAVTVPPVILKAGEVALVPSRRAPMTLLVEIAVELLLVTVPAVVTVPPVVEALVFVKMPPLFTVTAPFTTMVLAVLLINVPAPLATVIEVVEESVTAPDKVTFVARVTVRELPAEFNSTGAVIVCVPAKVVRAGAGPTKIKTCGVVAAIV